MSRLRDSQERTTTMTGDRGLAQGSAELTWNSLARIFPGLLPELQPALINTERQVLKRLPNGSTVV